jgi:hypothetical protein
MYNITEKKVYFNHYFFLNKDVRGRNNTDLIDTTILAHLLDFKSSAVIDNEEC